MTEAELREQIISGGKIYCDCPCPSPYCNSLTHPCVKPDKHYLQREQALIDIKKEILSAVADYLLSLEEMKKDEHKCTSDCNMNMSCPDRAAVLSWNTHIRLLRSHIEKLKVK